MLRIVLCIWLGACWLSQLRGAEPAVCQEEIRTAISRSLPLLANSAQEFTKHRECFSCHHQTLPVLALNLARQRGLVGDEKDIQQQIDWTAEFLGRNEERFRQGKGTGGQVDTAGYALWALAMAEYPPNQVTEAVAEYLLVRYEDRDHWLATSKRPPSEASDFTTTFLAIQGLSHFAREKQQERARKRIEQARQWLADTMPQDLEDHVFRLRALKAAGADAKAVEEAAGGLIARQRDDGGWAQLDNGDSDAYATGSALAALVETGGLTTDTEAYQRGLRFLLRRQLEDGSWHVATRSKPIQEYFETGFPHGADQFISIAATSWSICSLALALPDER